MLKKVCEIFFFFFVIFYERFGLNFALHIRALFLHGFVCQCVCVWVFEKQWRLSIDADEILHAYLAGELDGDREFLVDTLYI